MNDPLKKFLEEMKGVAASVNGIDMAVFSPEQRAALEEFKKKLNDRLKAMEPLEMVPAALDANWAVRDLAHAMQTVSELASAVREQMASLNSLVADGAARIQAERVRSGELVEKPKHEELLRMARDEGAREGEARARLQSERLAKAKAAGLADPPAELLASADFDARLAQANDHAAELRRRGVSLNGVFGRGVWADEATRKADLDRLAELPAASVRTQSATPGADPRIGAGGAQRPTVNVG